MDLVAIREREKVQKGGDGDEKGRRGKVINFVMPILLCSASVSTPFTFVIARVHKIIRTRGGERIERCTEARQN